MTIEFWWRQIFEVLIHKPSLESLDIPKKFGPDRFSRFDVYWIQTDRQPNKQTDRQAKFIYRSLRLYWLQDTSEKAWKRRNQGQHTTMVWILSTRQGEKSRYKWSLLRLLPNIRDVSCSRIKNCLLCISYVNDLLPF